MYIKVYLQKYIPGDPQRYVSFRNVDIHNVDQVHFVKLCADFATLSVPYRKFRYTEHVSYPISCYKVDDISP